MTDKQREPSRLTHLVGSLTFGQSFPLLSPGGWCVVLVSVESRGGGAGSGFVAPMEVLCDESDGGVSRRCGRGGDLGAGVV